MKREKKARERSLRAVEMLGSAIDVKVGELTESNRQLKRKIFDLYTIFEISRDFNSMLNYQTLIDSFLLTSLGQVGASTAALYLPVGAESKTLTLAKSKGFLHSREVEGKVDLGGRLAAYLAKTVRPITIAELEDIFPGEPEKTIMERFREGLVVPLVIKLELKGVSVMGSKVSGVGFTNDDIEFLSILANQFVVALENARLYESEKDALEELKDTHEQLVRTERLAAIGELSAKIAHEVNNPLSIISNYLRIWERDIEKPEKAHEHLNVVRQELSRIAGIIRQLLDFHRPRKVEKRPLDIRQVIDDVISLVGWQLEERGIAIERSIDGDLPPVIGSFNQLKQVFLNLIINARDFISEGGKLKISISPNKNNIRIVFTDTGPGVPEKDLPRIFEPFFTTKEDTSGTGLGLSVCYGIISEHGGQIEAGNVPGGGGRFVITLPVATGDRKGS